MTAGAPVRSGVAYACQVVQALGRSFQAIATTGVAVNRVWNYAPCESFGEGNGLRHRNRNVAEGLLMCSMYRDRGRIAVSARDRDANGRVEEA